MKENRSYQNIILGGRDVGFTPEKKGSKFCNEGKWDNFIAPLLPKNCSGLTFVELGCNSGLFLKLAKERGFSRVVGVDKSRRSYNYAVKYRKENGLDYTLINANIDSTFDYDNIPIADVTLMSNFHYYLNVDEFVMLLDKMRYKTRYCIVVTALERKDEYWRAESGMGAIRHYFREWKEVGSVPVIPVGDDTFPRKLCSIMFESPLERVKYGSLKTKVKRGSARISLAKTVASQDNIVDVKSTDYYKKVSEMHTRWNEKRILEHVESRIKTLYDVKHNGMKSPVFINHNNNVIDGTHRLTLLKVLGIDSVIVRRV